MANMIGSTRQLTPIDVTGRAQGLLDSPDNAGGYMQGMSAPKVSVPAGKGAKSAMINGPYGGKVKA